MWKEAYILDSSGIIGGFISRKTPNFTTSQVIMEVKDLKSKIFLQNALDDGLITIKEPSIEDMEEIEGIISKSGDILRLSDVDKNILALTVTLRKEKIKSTVVTDDYSMQNVLKIMGIPFRSVLTKGIEEVVGWVKFCKGCKKIYPNNYLQTECEICGSPISRKRTKKR